MAAITYTASEVRRISGPAPISVTGGASLTRGDLAYKDTADDDEYKQATNASRAASKAEGIAGGDAEDGTGFILWPSGTVVNFGASQTGVSEGVVYCLGTGGQIIPEADLTTGVRVVYVGVGLDTANYIEISVHYPTEDVLAP
ncbi:MAG: hypothetical protein ACR2RL_00850 [Gammaproteobacteria bacterium]